MDSERGDLHVSQLLFHPQANCTACSDTPRLMKAVSLTAGA